MSLWILETSSTKIAIPRMHPWATHSMGCLCHSFPVRLTLASKTLSCWDPPVTPGIYIGSTPYNLTASECTVDLYLNLYTLVVLTYQANRPGCPSSPPSQRQNPSNPDCNYLHIVRMLRKSLQEDQRQDPVTGSDRENCLGLCPVRFKHLHSRRLHKLSGQPSPSVQPLSQ